MIIQRGLEMILSLLLHQSRAVFLQKNKDYSHEKEWRYFTSVFTDDYVDIGDAINCVYIGDRCHRYKNKIAKLCYDNDIDVVFLKTSKNKFDFEEYFSSKP